MNLAGKGTQLVLLQRQHSRLEGRQRWVQVQHGAHIAAVEGFLIIGIAQEGQHGTFYAQGRLNAIRHILFVGHRIQVFHGLAGMFLMAGQVIVRAIGHAPQFAPAEGEQELEVRCRLGIEGQLFRLMIAQAQAFFLYAQVQQPVPAEGTPILEPFHILAWLAEELQLHLLKFTHTENEVAGGNLIAEGFADLRDTSRQFFAGGAHHILEIHKDALRRFRPQINLVGGVFRHAGIGLEHQVELTDAGKVLLAANRAHNVMLGNILFQLLICPAIAGFLAVCKVLNQFIRAETRLAGLAVHQRIIEAAHMTGCHPHFAVHQNSAVQPGVILALLHKFLPPGLLHIVLQLHAQGAEVPRVGQTAVNFAAGKNEAAVLAKSHQLIHR